MASRVWYDPTHVLATIGVMGREVRRKAWKRGNQAVAQAASTMAAAVGEGVSWIWYQGPRDGEESWPGLLSGMH